MATAPLRAPTIGALTMNSSKPRPRNHRARKPSRNKLRGNSNRRDHKRKDPSKTIQM